MILLVGGIMPYCGRSTMWLLQVTDLKQWGYCPRVVFYRYCLPLLCPETVKMRLSHEAHNREREREKQRTLTSYGLGDGQRHFDVQLASESLGLTGRVDLVVERASEVIPVDYKTSTRQPGSHFRLQLAAYGALCEEVWGKPTRRGFLYLIPLRRAEEITLTDRLRQRMTQAVRAIRQIIEGEVMPQPAKGRRKCVDCEFRRFCNDVV